MDHKLSSFCPEQRHDGVSQVQTTLSLGFQYWLAFLENQELSADPKPHVIGIHDGL